MLPPLHQQMRGDIYISVCVCARICGILRTLHFVCLDGKFYVKIVFRVFMCLVTSEKK